MIDGVDLGRLTEWMDDQHLGSGPLTDVGLLAGGTQNILLQFRRAGELYVLRRPPVNKRDNSDETMRREARVLAAIADTDVPHARLIAACPDVDVIGAAFYLMESVDGINPTVELPALLRDDASKRFEFGLAMADGAASIGAVDHVAAGLSDLGRPDGYLERQVERWRRQLDSYSSIENYAGPEIPHVQDGRRVARREPAGDVRARSHPRRLPPGQRDVRVRPSGARRRHRLGADHHRRPAHRSRLAARHVARCGRFRGRRRHAGSAVGRLSRIVPS